MVSKLLGMFKGEQTAVDPVCGMTVSTKSPGGGSYAFEGKTYYFCGTGCRLEFQEDPQGYLSGEKRIEM